MPMINRLALTVVALVIGIAVASFVPGLPRWVSGASV